MSCLVREFSLNVLYDVFREIAVQNQTIGRPKEVRMEIG